MTTMGERSGVGLVELTILEALDARRAWHNRRPVSCLKLLLASKMGSGSPGVLPTRCSSTKRCHGSYLLPSDRPHAFAHPTRTPAPRGRGCDRAGGLSG